MRQDRRLIEPHLEDLALGGLGRFVVSNILFSYFSPGELERIVLHKPAQNGPLRCVSFAAAGDLAHIESEEDAKDCVHFQDVLRWPDLVVIGVPGLDAEVEAAARAVGHLQLLVHQHLLPFLDLEGYLVGAEGHVFQVERFVLEGLEGEPTAGLVGAFGDLAPLELLKAAHIIIML